MTSDYYLRREKQKALYGTYKALWCVKCHTVINKCDRLRFGICAECLLRGVKLLERELKELRYGMKQKERR